MSNRATDLCSDLPHKRQGVHDPCHDRLQRHTEHHVRSHVRAMPALTSVAAHFRPDRCVPAFSRRILVAPSSRTSRQSAASIGLLCCGTQTCRHWSQPRAAVPFTNAGNGNAAAPDNTAAHRARASGRPDRLSGWLKPGRCIRRRQDRTRLRRRFPQNGHQAHLNGIALAPASVTANLSVGSCCPLPAWCGHRHKDRPALTGLNTGVLAVGPCTSHAGQLALAGPS